MKLKWKALLTACIAAISLSMFVGCGDQGEKEGGENNPPENSYGELCIEDVKVYINGERNTTFAEITPVFTVPDKAEPLTYTYDTSVINIDGNVVTAIKRTDETVNVRAKSEHFNTVFKVEVEYIRFSGVEASSLYDTSSYPVAQRAETCKAVTSDTTLFIGDSFMDSAFIGEYMDAYSAGKDVLNAGMSSTTTYHWEAAYSQIIGSVAPKNIVLHIGTNNFYDVGDLTEDTEESLKRLFMFMHGSYPESNIYWFNITQRTDTRYAQQVTQTNTDIANWCAKYNWITCVDTCSKVSATMLKDGVHPKTEYYSVFTDALVAAGCEIAVK